MKRILMVCEAFGGGVYSYVSQLCNDMCGHFDVTLAYTVRPQTPADYRVHLDSRIHLHEMSDFDARRLYDLPRDVKVVRTLKRLVKECSPDLIHLHSSAAGALGRIAYRHLDIPVVYTPHGYAHILMGPGPKSRIYGFVERVLGGTVHNAMTLTCCESEDEEARKFCDKTAWLETGINIDDLRSSVRQATEWQKRRFTVFALGRACAQKRPDVFNQIAKLVPEADFLWIGGGELERQLDAPNVTVTGWMPREEALGMAMGADAYLLCSYGEAIAMSLIENMFLKKLVLVSDVMGNRSVIRDGVNGYVCTKPEEYASRIREAMDVYPHELPLRAYQDVIDVYNTKVMAQKFIEFYDSMTS